MLKTLIMRSGADVDPNPNPKSARLLSPAPPSSPPPCKRSRRSVQKRVVSIPIQEVEAASRAKGASECAAPPSDSWAWRKYGQKPIKGSPYPRGYYRCSSSKGCPARKQVERSRADPTVVLVTYTCEHNHAWPPPPKGHPSSRHAPAKEEADPDPGPSPVSPAPPEPASDPDPEESRFSDLIAADDFWYSDVGSASSTSPPTDTLLYGSVFVGPADLAAEEFERIGDFKGDEEEDALFAGLGELPEYSTVFRRSYFNRTVPVHTAVHQ